EISNRHSFCFVGRYGKAELAKLWSFRFSKNKRRAAITKRRLPLRWGFYARAPLGSVEVMLHDELARCPHWAHTLRCERKDHRYYEILEQTLSRGFDYRYFAIKDTHGDVRAIQPFFIVDQDLLAGLNPTFGPVINRVRQIWPRFMRMRTLMVGCAAGEGHLDQHDFMSPYELSQIFASALVTHARKLGVSIIVLKEFP